MSELPEGYKQYSVEFDKKLEDLQNNNDWFDRRSAIEAVYAFCRIVTDGFPFNLTELKDNTCYQVQFDSHQIRPNQLGDWIRLWYKQTKGRNIDFITTYEFVDLKEKTNEENSPNAN